MSTHYEVIGISSDEPELMDVAREEGVKTLPLNLTRTISPFKDIKAVYQLYKIIKKEKPLIVHTHTPKAGIIGMMASWLARVPLRLHTVAGMPLMEAVGKKRTILNFVEKLTYFLATKVYPNSKGLYDFIVSENFVKKEKLKIIGRGSSNGIDTAHFDPDLYTTLSKTKLRNEIGIPQENFVFIFIGRLVRDKGVNELIEAFELLSEHHIKTSLLLVGGMESDLDPLLPKTLNCIKNHNAIFAVGTVPDVRPYLACSNALVFPSYREGFPNVVMQAASMGVPSIVSDINGCNEIITNKLNGLIVPVKDKIALKSAMESFIEKPESTKQFAEKTRHVMTENFERKEIWEQLLSEYRFLESQL